MSALTLSSKGQGKSANRQHWITGHLFPNLSAVLGILPRAVGLFISQGIHIPMYYYFILTLSVLDFFT